MAFFLGVQTTQLGLALILGYKSLELIKEILRDINRLIDDVRKNEI